MNQNSNKEPENYVVTRDDGYVIKYETFIVENVHLDRPFPQLRVDADFSYCFRDWLAFFGSTTTNDTHHFDICVGFADSDGEQLSATTHIIIAHPSDPSKNLSMPAEVTLKANSRNLIMEPIPFERLAEFLRENGSLKVHISVLVKYITSKKLRKMNLFAANNIPPERVFVIKFPNAFDMYVDKLVLTRHSPLFTRLIEAEHRDSYKVVNWLVTIRTPLEYMLQMLHGFFYIHLQVGIEMNSFFAAAFAAQLQMAAPIRLIEQFWVHKDAENWLFLFKYDMPMLAKEHFKNVESLEEIAIKLKMIDIDLLTTRVMKVICQKIYRTVIYGE